MFQAAHPCVDMVLRSIQDKTTVWCMASGRGLAQLLARA
uniref:Uncharacterized protein n=1 Tax=Arundo donax TaxID=35708 RepID=A0A0A8ZK93_ARUDO